MTVEETYSEYLEAVLSGDRRRAFEVVERAHAAGVGLHAFYLGVFQPALREIGRLWQRNRLSVAEEHLATAITLSAMLRLSGEMPVPAGAGRTLIAACPPSERHEIGLRMLCDFLDLEGWDTIFLGATVPLESLVEMVRDRRPDVLALSASIAPHLPQLRSTISAIREATKPQQPFVLVGGRPFLDDPTLASTIGADATAKDAGEAVSVIRGHFT